MRGRVLIVGAVLCLAVLAIALVARTADQDPVGNPQIPPGVTHLGPLAAGTTVFVFPTSPEGELRQLGNPIRVGTQGVPAGVVYSSVAAWVYNAGTEPLQIVSWAPIGPQGLTVTDVGLIPDLGGFSGYSGAVGYPPPGRPLGAGLHPLPFELHAVGPLDPTVDHGRGVVYWLLVGYQRDAATANGTVEGVTLTYTVRGETKQFNLPIHLELCEITCPE